MAQASARHILVTTQETCEDLKKQIDYANKQISKFEDEKLKYEKDKILQKELGRSLGAR